MQSFSQRIHTDDDDHHHDDKHDAVIYYYIKLLSSIKSKIKIKHQRTEFSISEKIILKLFALFDLSQAAVAVAFFVEIYCATFDLFCFVCFLLGGF